MAIDSEIKRKSITAVGLYSLGPVVVPDSSIDLVDRRTIGYSYSFEEAAAVIPFAAYEPTLQLSVKSKHV